jgi:hypothetical protein
MRQAQQNEITSIKACAEKQRNFKSDESETCVNIKAVRKVGIASGKLLARKTYHAGRAKYHSNRIGWISHHN